MIGNDSRQSKQGQELIDSVFVNCCFLANSWGLWMASFRLGMTEAAEELAVHEAGAGLINCQQSGRDGRSKVPT